MHSTIYEIREFDFQPEEWAIESDILDDVNCSIEDVDYYEAVSAEERCDAIEHFFLRCFPEGSFQIVGNFVARTAEVMFIGDIKALYDRWLNDIKEQAAALNYENAEDLGLHRAHYACMHPFGLSSKFYMPDWTACTADANDFLGYLRYLDAKHGGRPYRLYIGQVFDYHF